MPSPGYMGILDVNGSKYRLVSGSIVQNQTPSFYNHINGFMTGIPQRPIFRPSRAFSEANFTIAVTDLSDVPFFYETMGANPMGFASSLHCSLGRALYGVINKWSVSCTAKETVNVNINVVGYLMNQVGSDSGDSSGKVAGNDMNISGARFGSGSLPSFGGSLPSFGGSLSSFSGSLSSFSGSLSSFSGGGGGSGGASTSGIYTNAAKLVTWDKVFVNTPYDIKYTSVELNVNNNISPIFTTTNGTPTIAWQGGIREVGGSVGFFADYDSFPVTLSRGSLTVRILGFSATANGTFDPSVVESSPGVVKGTMKFVGNSEGLVYQIE